MIRHKENCDEQSALRSMSFHHDAEEIRYNITTIVNIIVFAKFNFHFNRIKKQNARVNSKDSVNKTRFNFSRYK